MLLMAGKNVFSKNIPIRGVKGLKQNKRNYRRITMRTVMTATGIVTPHGNQIRKSYQLQLEDLSAGGLCYISKFAIPNGTRLDLVVQYADRSVPVTVEVVRARKNENGGYNIGCKFVGIDRLDQESIIRYVTLSSVRDAPSSSFYSQTEMKKSANIPISCKSCRCNDCGARQVCRPCNKALCGKYYCRMYISGRQDLR